MFEIQGVSSLNLRTGRNRVPRAACEPMRFKCAILQKRMTLGKSTHVYVRIVYRFNGDEESIELSGKAIDILCDLVRWGPRVVQDHTWKIRAHVVRVSLVSQDLQCFRCMGRSTTHIYLKYDDLTVPARSSHHDAVRVCARCLVTYINMLQQSEARTHKYPSVVPEVLYDMV